jgi:hypothetical protein
MQAITIIITALVVIGAVFVGMYIASDSDEVQLPVSCESLGGRCAQTCDEFGAGWTRDAQQTCTGDVTTICCRQLG